jgi:hypothetical protein
MVSAWDLHLHLEKRAVEEANGRASGEILDDDGQKLALVSNGKGDSSRCWNVESGKVVYHFRESTDLRYLLQLFERRFKLTLTG